MLYKNWLKIGQLKDPLNLLVVSYHADLNILWVKAKRLARDECDQSKLHGKSIQQTITPFNTLYPLGYKVTDWSSAETYIAACIVDYYRQIDMAA